MKLSCFKFSLEDVSNNKIKKQKEIKNGIQYIKIVRHVPHKRRVKTFDGWIRCSWKDNYFI